MQQQASSAAHLVHTKGSSHDEGIFVPNVVGSTFATVAAAPPQEQWTTVHRKKRANKATQQKLAQPTMEQRIFELVYDT